MKVEVAVPGSPSIIGPYGLCRRKLTLNLLRAQELCESRGGRGLPVHNRSLRSLSKTNTVSGLRSCVKVEVAVLGSPSLINLMVSVDVKS